MMINKNNKSLDLYNGETGLIVSFKGDETKLAPGMLIRQKK